MFLDVNSLSTDGSISLNGYWPSDDEKLMAIGFRKFGSDRFEIEIFDVETRERRKDRIKNVMPAVISWVSSSDGFFYGVSFLHNCMKTKSNDSKIDVFTITISLTRNQIIFFLFNLFYKF